MIRKSVLLILSTAFLICSLLLRAGNLSPDDFIDEPAMDKSAVWSIPASKTLINKSKEELTKGNLDTAEQLALQAWSKNIASGRATAQLLSVYTTKENFIKGDEIAKLVSQLWPAHTGTRSQLANYWTQRGDFTKVLPEWNALLIRDSSTHKQLFPVLKQIINNPQTFNLLLPFIQYPPSWWDNFFIDLTRDKDSLGSIKSVYTIRLNADKPLDENERRYFVQRLIKEKQMTEAYFSWLGGLNTKELALSGLVYDSGFEGNSFNTGFDWSFSKPKGVKIRTGTTNGIRGAKALQITLNHKRINFRHVSQRLALTPGAYQLSGRYRLNRLKTEKGLSWKIYCTGDKTTKIAESMAFKGRTPWSEFSTGFDIPPQNCESQILRLEASSRYAHHHAFKGSLWFDDIAIYRDNNTQEKDQ